MRRPTVYPPLRRSHCSRRLLMQNSGTTKGDDKGDRSICFIPFVSSIRGLADSRTAARTQRELQAERLGTFVDPGIFAVRGSVGRPATALKRFGLPADSPTL